MPFTNEEANSIEFMVKSYKQSKEKFVFSEENNVLWNKLFNEAQAEQRKHEYTTFDLGSLIMIVIKKKKFGHLKRVLVPVPLQKAVQAKEHQKTEVCGTP